MENVLSQYVFKCDLSTEKYYKIFIIKKCLKLKRIGSYMRKTNETLAILY